MNDFPPFCFYYIFMKPCLSQPKTKNAVKDIIQNFTSNKLNEETSEHPFVKKLSLWIFGTSTDFLWCFMGPWKVKMFILKYYLLWTFLSESANYVLVKPMPVMNPVFQNKSGVTEQKNWRSLLFWSIRRSYLNHASHLNTFRNDLLFAVQGAIQILRSHRGGAGGSRKKQTKAYRGRVELSGQIVRILKDFNDV